MTPTEETKTIAHPTVKGLEAMLQSRATKFHMFLVILACVASAALLNYVLFHHGVPYMWLRYPLALGLGYAVFFAGIWVWLELSPFGRYLRAQESGNTAFDSGDVDMLRDINISTSGGGNIPDSLAGGGGQFDGGGASGSWDVPGASTVADAAGSSDSDSPVTAAAGAALDSDDGGKLILLLILLLAVLAALFGAAAYVIYEAPHILAEVVFQIMLSSHMVRGARAISAVHWQRVLFARTWKPFAVVCGMAMIFSFYCAINFPDVHTMGEAILRILA